MFYSFYFRIIMFSIIKLAIFFVAVALTVHQGKKRKRDDQSITLCWNIRTEPRFSAWNSLSAQHNLRNWPTSTFKKKRLLKQMPYNLFARLCQSSKLRYISSLIPYIIINTLYMNTLLPFSYQNLQISLQCFRIAFIYSSMLFDCMYFNVSQISSKIDLSGTEWRQKYWWTWLRYSLLIISKSVETRWVNDERISKLTGSNVFNNIERFLDQSKSGKKCQELD